MNFDLNEQQKEFQQSVDAFLTAECNLQRALAPHETAVADIALWQGLMDLGLGTLIVPERWGGLGLGLLDLAVVTERIGRFVAPGPFLDHALGTLAVVLAGSETQKEQWLGPLAAGALRATVALAEGKGLWMADAWELDGTDTLSGKKFFVPHAQDADLIIIGCQGGRLAIVQKHAPGLTVTQIPSTDAGRLLYQIELDNTPVEFLPKAVGARLVDAGLILLAADAYGGAARCVEMAVEYAKLREQFGRTIGSFQALKHQLADMALSVEPCVGLYWFAAHAFDMELADATEAAALAKSHITELYPRIARSMIESHGGIGYTWEFGAHIWLKRALFDQAFLGMPQAHRQRVAVLSGWET